MKLQGVIRSDDLEQYGRRMSVRVQNVAFAEGEKENPELLLREINNKIANVNIKLSPSDCVRYHRSSKPKVEKGVQVSQCLVKLVHWSKRHLFHGVNKKACDGNKDCRVFHDLTKRRLGLLNSTRDQLNTLSVPANTFVYADINSGLKLRIGDKSFGFNTQEDFDELIRQQQ